MVRFEYAVPLTLKHKSVQIPVYKLTLGSKSKLTEVQEIGPRKILAVINPLKELTSP